MTNSLPLSARVTISEMDHVIKENSKTLDNLWEEISRIAEVQESVLVTLEEIKKKLQGE